MKKSVFAMVAAMAAVSATAGEWEISAGGAFRPGIKGDFTVISPVELTMPKYTATYGSTKSAAEAETKAYVDSDGVLVFDGGFIAPEDCAGIAGETWNWKIDDASMYSEANQNITLSSGYSEMSYSYSESVLTASGEDDLSGISLGLGRVLWNNDKFGIDLNIGASFYDDAELLNARGVVAKGATSITEGEITTTISTPAAWVGEPDMVNPDGTMGAGTFDGPGPVITFDPAKGVGSLVNTIGSETKHESVSRELTVFAQGEYSSYDLYAVIEPYFEPVKWVRLNARLGIAVVKSEFDTSAMCSINGKSVWTGSESFDDTAVCAIVGAGIGVNITDWLFVRGGADWYLGMDDMDIDGTFVQGNIERGDFVWRAEVGVRF